jgi:hypothetical protein
MLVGHEGEKCERWAFLPERCDTGKVPVTSPPGTFAYHRFRATAIDPSLPEIFS